MSRAGDDDDGVDMPLSELLDEDTVDAIVSGDEVDDALARFVAMADRVRALGDEPLPAPSPALEAVLSGAPTHADPGMGAAPSEVPPPRRLRLVGRVAGLGALAKVALGTSAAAAGVVVAGAGGALPDPVDRKVRAVIEAVTPVEFAEQERPGAGDPSGPASGPAPRGGPGADPARAGDPGADPGSGSRPAGGAGGGTRGEDVARDATGASDGRPGVEGADVSGEAPGAGNRPPEPGGGTSGAPPDKGPPVLPPAPPSVPTGPEGTPGGTAPGATVPSGTAPGSTAPGVTAPRATGPASTVPGSTASHTTASRATAPA